MSTIYRKFRNILWPSRSFEGHYSLDILRYGTTQLSRNILVAMVMLCLRWCCSSVLNAAEISSDRKTVACWSHMDVTIYHWQPSTMTFQLNISHHTSLKLANISHQQTWSRRRRTANVSSIKAGLLCRATKHHESRWHCVKLMTNGWGVPQRPTSPSRQLCAGCNTSF